MDDKKLKVGILLYILGIWVAVFGYAITQTSMFLVMLSVFFIVEVCLILNEV